MDLEQWKYQQAIDQLGHNAKVSREGGSALDVLNETILDVRAMGVDPCFVDLAARELLIRGACQKLLEDAHLKHNRLDQLLNEAIAADFPERLRDQILEGIGA